MGERITRFSNLVDAEEKKRPEENPFEKSNRTVRGAETPNEEEIQENIADVDKNIEEEKLKENSKLEKKTTEKNSDVTSRRLNISDITDAAQRAKKSGGRSRTFYIQDDVYEKLEMVAQDQGIKPSKLLHIILSNVLDKM